jgi:hypothetical protein
LTDLTGKHVPFKIPWEEIHQQAFDQLKIALCEAATKRLYIIDHSKPYHLSVDCSDYAVGGILSQIGDDGVDRPIAFTSQKLTKTQQKWSTVEKEAYAALVNLTRFRHWLFSCQVVLHSDHNPLTFLVESAPKSAKLMRWALALQEFDHLTFVYKRGSLNVPADTLSRLCTNE